MVDYYIDKLKDFNPFLVDKFLKWLEHSTDVETKEFIKKDGIFLIYNIINDKSIEKNTSILKILLILLEHTEDPNIT